MLTFFLSLICAILILPIISAYGKQQEEKTKRYSEQLSKMLHIVAPEKVSNTEYWYDQYNQFLGQGSNLNEVIDHVKVRFPDHWFITPYGVLSSDTQWKFESVESFTKKR